MKNKETVFLNIIIFILLMSCKEKSRCSLQEVVCNLQEEEYILIFWNDAFVDSLYVEEFDEEGVIEGLIAKYFYIKGDLYKIQYVANDFINGWDIEYYPNGNKKHKNQYIYNKPYGSFYSFYENGHPNTYKCYDVDVCNKRIKTYDSIGNVICDEGNILGQFWTISPSFDFETNTDIIIDIMVATPFNEVVKVDLILKDKDTFENFEIRNNTAFFKYALKEVGNYDLIAFAKSIDTITNKIYYDTASVTLNIY